MQAAILQSAFTRFYARSAHGARSRTSMIAWAATLTAIPIFLMPLAALASADVEFDFARVIECRDITSGERLAQYPMQRLIEVALPVSVRFNDVSRDDVDEISIEVSGAAAGLRVQDFAPATQLASEITHEIETTTTSKRSRSLDGTLGGSLPIPGADVAARITPSISAGLANSDTATEKINRLPPKHVVVVSGTYAEGRGVFFKLKRTSQTSLEGVHELAVTFVAPRTWRAIALEVECNAVGTRKTLWVKQQATLGHAQRYVQLVPAAVGPINHVVCKPAETSPPTTEKAPALADNSAASPTKWRPVRVVPVAESKVDVKAATLPTATSAEDTIDKPVKAKKAAATTDKD
jgi:hypothetical protein